MDLFWQKIENGENFRIEEVMYGLSGSKKQKFDKLARGHFCQYVNLDSELWFDIKKISDLKYIVLNKTFTKKMFSDFKDAFFDDDIAMSRFCLYSKTAIELVDIIPKKYHQLLKINGKKNLDSLEVSLKSNVDRIGTKLSNKMYIRRSIDHPSNQLEMDEIFAKTMDIDDYSEYKESLNDDELEEFDDMMENWFYLSQNPMFKKFEENYIDIAGFCGNPNIDEKFIKKYIETDDFDLSLFSSNKWLKGKKFEHYKSLLPAEGMRYNHYLRPEYIDGKTIYNSYDISNINCKSRKYSAKCIDPILNPSIPFKYFN